MVSRRRLLTLLPSAATLFLGVRFAHAAADALQNGSFKREVIALLAQRHPEWTITPGIDPAAFDLSEKNGALSVHINVSNLYWHVHDMASDEREREIIQIIENVISALNAKSTAQDKDKSFVEIKARLRLQIVPDDYKKTAPDLICRPFFAGLSIAYTIDGDNTYTLIRQGDAKTWAVTQSEIEAQATANLEAISASLVLKATPNAKAGVFVVVDTSDGYDAARLLLPGFMARLRATAQTHRVFAGIPNRDFLVAWTPDFSARRGFAAKIAQDAQTRPHPLTDAIFVSSDDGLRLATPAELAELGR